MDIFPNYVKATVTLSCEDFSLAVFQTRVINRQSNYIVLATPKLRAKVNTNSFLLFYLIAVTIPPLRTIKICLLVFCYATNSKISLPLNLNFRVVVRMYCIKFCSVCSVCVFSLVE